MLPLPGLRLRQLMALRASSSYWPCQSLWSGVNGDEHCAEGCSSGLASVLMVLACQCFLFEEQFNKQSLAFHVRGKIGNGILLPGSPSSACDQIKAVTGNTGQPGSKGWSLQCPRGPLHRLK